MIDINFCNKLMCSISEPYRWILIERLGTHAFGDRSMREWFIIWEKSLRKCLLDFILSLKENFLNNLETKNFSSFFIFFWSFINARKNFEPESLV